jgi:hypothetical protein
VFQRECKKILAALLLTLICVSAARGQSPGPDCQDVRGMLLSLSKRGDTYRDLLPKLFLTGDRCMKDLIAALDDPEFDVNVAAQEIIRYTGNEKGVAALDAWNARNRKPYPVWGPIPVPISEFDYQMIEDNFADRTAADLGLLGSRYLYALAIDDSPRAKSALDKARVKITSCEECVVSNRIIKLITSKYPFQTFKPTNDLPKAVLDNSFFISPDDKRQTTAKLLSFNASKDKALVELHINRGILAEEWYHVVIRKHKKGWSFFSITFIAVS